MSSSHFTILSGQLAFQQRILEGPFHGPIKYRWQSAGVRRSRLLRGCLPTQRHWRSSANGALQYNKFSLLPQEFLKQGGAHPLRWLTLAQSTFWPTPPAYGTAPLCYKHAVQYGVSSAVGRIVSSLLRYYARAEQMFFAVLCGLFCWPRVRVLGPPFGEGWREPFLRIYIN